MDDKTDQPTELGEVSLEEANGGIGLLLPAVQKVREAAARPCGVNVAPGDGSVRFVKGSVDTL